MAYRSESVASCAERALKNASKATIRAWVCNSCAFAKAGIEITFRAGIDKVKLQAKPSGRDLQVLRLRVSIRVGRIDEQSHGFGRWHSLMQQFQELWPDLDTQIG